MVRVDMVHDATGRNFRRGTSGATVRVATDEGGGRAAV